MNEFEQKILTQYAEIRARITELNLHFFSNE